MKKPSEIRLRKLETAAANCLTIIASRQVQSNEGWGEMTYSEYMEIKKWLHDALKRD